ncbi:MAG: FAD-binding protein, partial [Ruminococcaceae bacterium]|nr:FAD-binding protein [Oscillospiraceae bacterium]
MAYQINAAGCSCCHQCKVNCPVSAIRFKGSKYWIDPEKCIDCGLCAELCHNCVIAKVGEEPKAAEKHELIHRECDVLVVGGGGSGLIAAAKAACETGKKVIVLEKSKKCG